MERLSLRTACTALSRLSASGKVAIRKLLSTDGLFLLFFSVVTAQRHLVRAVAYHPTNFPHRNHWQEPDEQQKTGEEQAKASHQDANIDFGGIEHAPARRQKCPMQRDHNNDEPLEPHPDIDQNGNH